MTVSFYRASEGLMVTAPSGDTAMFKSEPVIHWSMKVQEVEKWLTTLEEALAAAPTPELFPHRQSLRDLHLELTAMMMLHQRQHEGIVTTAPTADDLIEYLAAYASRAA